MADSIESSTDVLIIGAGPSGLMAAYWMARCGIDARVIDKRGIKIFRGHADGLRSRTLELLDSMGVAQRVLQEGHELFSMSSWAPDENGKLSRQGSAELEITPPYVMVALNQGRIERFLLDTIEESSNLEVERGVIAESLHYDEGPESDSQAYPNHAQEQGRHGRDAESQVCNWCDGAHSWTREQLNIPFEGSTTDHVWGVIDIVPITDYPDIRRPCSVNSVSGIVLIIPREKNTVRFYVPLQEEHEFSRDFDRSAVTLESIHQRVKKIMSPFHFDYHVCKWWTVYQVGRRIAQTNAKGRIYLAGDAVHTHSPKIGMGMNMRMQDGFNIGWKVALVVKGLARSSILDTYKSEHYPLAEMLLEFDRQWSAFFLHREQQSGHPAPVLKEKLAAMRDVMRETEHFSQGHTSYYKASPLVCKVSKAVAKHLSPGEKLLPVARSDGRFRILLLAGDMRSKEQASRVWTCGDILAGLLKQFTPAKYKLDLAIDVKAFHSAPFEDVELDMFPSIVHHFDKDEGCDLTKVWSDSKCNWGQQSDGNAGALIAMRPDQYIGWMGELEGAADLTSYFHGIFVERKVRPAL
ncbi:putative phenol 2-monooxygenase [Aspergillus homomorphus CBS 101889]|uniref:Phenol 2-monooxygenase n=1 Tax=Aspergillus homomorphus (strain CBS 101889) TaxID=1450537 RepID=A0A395IBA9_ASPHC|nr:phenol 2-monooxygenase [Aspergillus homomorphus CBS 101889]RAL17099.1 phenol 2-monooxygenase [Aspergillus homomorphus CBS 101889]